MKHLLLLGIVFLAGIIGGIFIPQSAKSWLVKSNTTGDTLEISVEEIMSLSYNTEAMTQ